MEVSRRFASRHLRAKIRAAFFCSAVSSAAEIPRRCSHLQVVVEVKRPALDQSSARCGRLRARAVGQEWGGGGGSFAQNVDQTRHDFQLHDIIDTRLAGRNNVLPLLAFSFHFADNSLRFPDTLTCTPLPLTVITRLDCT